jgi:hypothetical protein
VKEFDWDNYARITTSQPLPTTKALTETNDLLKTFTKRTTLSDHLHWQPAFPVIRGRKDGWDLISEI